MSGEHGEVEGEGDDYGDEVEQGDDDEGEEDDGGDEVGEGDDEGNVEEGEVCDDDACLDHDVSDTAAVVSPCPPCSPSSASDTARRVCWCWRPLPGQWPGPSGDFCCPS